MWKTLSFLALAVGIAAVAGIGLAAQEEGSAWEVPEEARAVANPVEATPEAIEAGKALYTKHCVMCHGESGKGDGPATSFIKPAPADITPADVQGRMTDGEIFYKITNGKRPMPPMNRKMSDEERWQVVLFVRTLASS
jgi:mono/diheme cytochrome c family protein